MAFLYLPAEAKSLVRTIYKFQHDTDNKKASRIESTLQELINCVAATELLDLSLLVSKKKTRVAVFASSHFYNFF